MAIQKYLLAGVALITFLNAASAADIDIENAKVDLPAVSQPNGFIDLGVGFSDLESEKLRVLMEGGLSLAMPIGDSFGAQADFAVVNQFAVTGANGVLHGFTRDPENYLVGAIGGYGDFGPTDAWFMGPEIELYGSQVSFEAVGGYIDVDRGPKEGGHAFVLADVAFYPTDNLRLVAGGSSIAKFEAGHLGMEWLLQDQGLPVALKLDGRFGEYGYMQGTAGVTIYFGPDGKSLIRRHREDNVRNRALDIFKASGGTSGFGTLIKPIPTGGTGGTGGSGGGNPLPPGGNPPPQGGNPPPPQGGNPPPDEIPTDEQVKNSIGTNCSEAIFDRLLDIVGPSTEADGGVYRDDSGICLLREVEPT